MELRMAHWLHGFPAPESPANMPPATRYAPAMPRVPDVDDDDDARPRPRPESGQAPPSTPAEPRGLLRDLWGFARSSRHGYALVLLLAAAIVCAILFVKSSSAGSFLYTIQE